MTTILRGRTGNQPCSGDAVGRVQPLLRCGRRGRRRRLVIVVIARVRGAGAGCCRAGLGCTRCTGCSADSAAHMRRESRCDVGRPIRPGTPRISLARCRPDGQDSVGNCTLRLRLLRSIVIPGIVRCFRGCLRCGWSGGRGRTGTSCVRRWLVVVPGAVCRVWLLVAAVVLVIWIMRCRGRLCGRGDGRLIVRVIIRRRLRSICTICPAIWCGVGRVRVIAIGIGSRFSWCGRGWCCRGSRNWRRRGRRGSGRDLGRDRCTRPHFDSHVVSAGSRAGFWQSTIPALHTADRQRAMELAKNGRRRDQRRDFRICRRPGAQ